jgi:hypothetical protein
MFDLVATARAWAQLGPLTTPDGARHAFYAGRFAAFRDLYLRNKGHFV